MEFSPEGRQDKDPPRKFHKARCHGRGHARFRGIVAGDFQIVDHCVGSDGFGDDVARALAAGTGPDVVTDENDDAAVFLWSIEEILRGEEDGVVDVGGAAGLKAADHVGDLGFVVRERDAHLGFGGKGEKGHLVFRLEGG